MKMKSPTRRAVLSVLTALCLGIPALPVEQCRDYAWFRVSGEDLNGLTAEKIRGKLEALGYKKFPFSYAAQMPERAMKALKPGMVILIDNGAHAGFVNSSGTIDHFIQLQGEVGKVRAPEALPTAPVPNNAGGLFLNDSLKQMFNRRFKKDPGEVEVWRPK